MPITLSTTLKATNHLKSGKVAGSMASSQKFGNMEAKHYTQTSRALRMLLGTGKTTARLYKNKGEKSDCSNRRGITLLSIAAQILARVLLNRLIPAVAEHYLPESQCSFRANRGTIDIVFVFYRVFFVHFHIFVCLSCLKATPG